MSSLTGCTLHGHIAEVTAFDDFHRQTARGAVISQADQKFRHAAMLHRLGRRGTVASRQAADVHLAVPMLENEHRDNQIGKSIRNTPSLHYF